MNVTPEMKAQLEEQKKQCIHCKLISGEQPGAKTVFKDSKMASMLDIYPIVKGHLSYMPIEHYPMPAYIPGDEFTHMFALIPNFAKALKKSLVRTGFNVFIAVGGVAGQMSPHFLVHLLARESGDKLKTLEFKGKGERMEAKTIEMLGNNLPIMMRNHFGRHPASWHSGKGIVPEHLADVASSDDVVYEDEQVLVVAPVRAENKAHLVVYSKVEPKLIENLSQDESSHLFFAGSFASTAIFEGMGCHATNIILKSGVSDDNKDGQLSLHVFGLKINWQADQNMDGLDQVEKEIKDEMWQVKLGASGTKVKGSSRAGSESKSAAVLGKKKVKKIGGKKKKGTESLEDLAARIAPAAPEDEISRAIKKVRK